MKLEKTTIAYNDPIKADQKRIKNKVIFNQLNWWRQSAKKLNYLLMAIRKITTNLDSNWIGLKIIQLNTLVRSLAYFTMH